LEEKMGKNKALDTAIIVAIIGVIGTIIAAILGSPWFGNLIKTPTATATVPTSTGPVTATSTTLPTNTTLVFQEDFEDEAASGFAFGVGTWEIVKDKSNHVLQVTADTPSQTVLADAVFGPADFASGIIEFKLKFIQPGKVYLNFREQDGPGYYLLLDTVGGQIVLGYKSPGVNGLIDYAALAAQPATFQTGTSFRIHIEVRGEQMTVSVDNNRIFSASDPRLLLGRLTFTASSGTVASFDDIQVWSFGP
jgi:hypothetical protein